MVSSGGVVQTLEHLSQVEVVIGANGIDRPRTQLFGVLPEQKLEHSQVTVVNPHPLENCQFRYRVGTSRLASRQAGLAANSAEHCRHRDRLQNEGGEFRAW